MPIMRKSIVDDDRFWRILQMRFDVVVPGHARDLCDVKRSITEGDARRHLQAAGDFDDLISAIVFIAIHDGVDIARIHRAHENRAIGSESHLSGVGDACSVKLNIETGRKFDRLEWQRLPTPQRDNECRNDQNG
jgi:hypothetical protein